MTWWCQLRGGGSGSSMGGALQIVATRGTICNSKRQGTAGGRTDIRFETRNVYYTGCQPVAQLCLAQPGFYLLGGASGEAPVGNDVYWETAFELSSPSVYNSNYVYGANLATILNNAPMVLTAPQIGYDLPAGSFFYVRQSISISDATKFLPVGTGGAVTGSPTDQGFLSAALVSQVQGVGAMTNPSGGASASNVTPGMVLGVPAAPMVSVIYMGDSIADGTADTGDGHGNLGFIPRGLWSVNGYPVPWAKQAVGGWSLVYSTIQYAANMRSFWPACTHIISQFGTNDIAALGQTLAQMQTLYTNLWTAMKREIGPYGDPLKTAQVLIMPRTTSSNSFIDAAGQTPIAGFTVGGVRDQVNAWIVSQVGGGLLDAAIDVNQYVEDQANHGKWITNGVANYPTSDGVHPSTALHILAAQAVNTWAQGQTP